MRQRGGEKGGKVYLPPPLPVQFECPTNDHHLYSMEMSGIVVIRRICEGARVKGASEEDLKDADEIRTQFRFLEQVPGVASGVQLIMLTSMAEFFRGFPNARFLLVRS